MFVPHDNATSASNYETSFAGATMIGGKIIISIFDFIAYTNFKFNSNSVKSQNMISILVHYIFTEYATAVVTGSGQAQLLQ